ncbi:uncharacterized protein FIBRA_04127 [Fibroporia radiculosa]|uniref:DHHA2 domain-containing protein n=1 Tax=Fibroporia radiculosa TaxID=599839 RepID=J4IA01_9APHY|nr:uncharacterized protein FIBRA_04127 [Fibroporia radiculosa]CCM02051.1 predicted protein [Fibroporia radiculosa]
MESDALDPAAASASRSLPDFLRETKREYIDAVKAGKGGEWTVAMGNEAGDLDSAASAIAYAWYAGTIRHSPTVPLVQTPRSDLHLRAENEHALALANVDAHDLLCVDDVPQAPSAPFPSTRFALVDHNRLAQLFSVDNPVARVVAIVDHHEDEGLYRGEAHPRIVVKGVGSCASLVTQLLEEHCPERVPPELATLLLAAILVDTGGLVPGGKAVDADHRAAAFLAPRSTLSATSSSLHASPAIRTLADTLQHKKASVAHLGTRDLLRRDYKEYALAPSWAPTPVLRVGLASVPLALGVWLPREGGAFADAAQAWMDERGLAALGVLTSFREAGKANGHGHGKHRREQLWTIRVRDDGERELATRLVRGLEGSAELALKERRWAKVGAEEDAGFGPGIEVRVWKQKNAHATRKATAPLVKAIVEGSGSDNRQSGL